MGKPYSFVPLLGKKSYNINNEELYRGKIKVRITMLTPLYISRSEIWEKNEKTFRKSFYKINGRCLIPGSSLKGVTRTIAQTVSYSCINTKQNKFMIEKDSVCNDWCDCIVCKTFGRMSYKSKVVFRDLLLKEGDTYTQYVPKLMNPHPEKAFYKENGKFKGIKFYHHGINKIVETGSIPVEAIKPNSYFEGEIVFENLNMEQLQLLCFSCGLDGSIQLKLGYNKPGYFGSCNVEVIEAKMDKIQWLNVSKETFDPKAVASRWGENDIKILQNINKVREILSYKNTKKISDWKVNECGQKSY